MRTPFLLVAAVTATVAGAALTGTGCNTTKPTAADATKAVGHYDVALALVNEAQQSATAGDDQTQDLKYREALRELLEGHKTGALASDGEYLLAFVYFIGFGRTADAERHVLRAIVLRQEERQEEYPEAENLLGNVLVASGRAQLALAHFDKARTNLLYATPYFSEQGIGDAYVKLGRHDEAAQHFQRALVAQPDLCGAYVKLAEVEVARGDDKRAQQVLSDFFARCDSERLRASTGPRILAPAFYMLGDSKLRSGDRDAAAQALRACVERFGELPIARECNQKLSALESG